MTIGKRLKKLREAADMTQEELGSKFVSDDRPEGFGKQTVAAWESDRNSLISDHIVKLCQIFNVTADYLLIGKQHNFSAATLQFAEKFEKLDEKQRRHFDQIYMLVRTAATDARVEQSFSEVPKDVKYGRRASDKIPPTHQDADREGSQ